MEAPGIEPCRFRNQSPAHRYGFRRSTPFSSFFSDFLGAARGRCGATSLAAAGSEGVALGSRLAAGGAAESGAGGALCSVITVIADGLDFCMLVIAGGSGEVAEKRFWPV